MDSARNNPHRLKPWVITQLAAEINHDLALCTTESERINCLAITTKEIRELRDEKIAAGTRFTPGEISVLKHYSISTPAELGHGNLE